MQVQLGDPYAQLLTLSNNMCLLMSVVAVMVVDGLG